MNLIENLTMLEAASLIQLHEIQPELQYLFRHNLVQEAVYESLLKSDRRRLHHLVGVTLEGVYPERRDELAPILGYHFQNAGDHRQAMEYYSLAGERAIGTYAIPEAISYFTQALSSAVTIGYRPSQLYRRRAYAYEVLGDYGPAQQDYLSALDIAKREKDQRAEWQILNDLGMLSARNNYPKTGEYYLQALDLALLFDDAALLAHSYNHMGNWHMNIEKVGEARFYHQKALEIFEELRDLRGIAETLDFLGMTSYVNGELADGADYSRRSMELFRELGDRQRIAHSLSSLSIRSNATYTSQPLPGDPAPLPEVIKDARHALEICQEIGWRSGEAYTYMQLARAYGPQGQYDQAFQSAHSGLKIAQEIQHDQWVSIIYSALGQISSDILAPEKAAGYFNRAYAAAIKTGSSFLTRVATSGLALAAIQRRDLVEAEKLLGPVFEGQIPQHTLTGRWNWTARVKLEIYRRQPDEAITILEQFHPASQYLITAPGKGIPYLAWIYAKALADIHEYGQAEQVLRAAQSICQQQGTRSLLWRIHRSLTHLYLQMNRTEDQAYENQAGYKIVADIATTIPEENLRQQYLERVRETWLDGYLE